MLKNSRVARTPDMGRMGRALAGPGMDTRTWESLAIVTAVHVDNDEGVFVNVRLMPSRDPGTARLGVEYAGNGFGLYAPVMVDDEVLVAAPSGDPDQGLVVTRRLHSPSDPPPAELGENPEDVLLFVRPERSIRIITAGGGNVIIEARGDGKVKLGSEDAERGVARIDDSVSLKGAALLPAVAELQALLDARYVISDPTKVIPAGASIGTISSASDKVESA